MRDVRLDESRDRRSKLTASGREGLSRRGDGGLSLAGTSGKMLVLERMQSLAEWLGG